jgi:DNA polymerase-3 subunit delta
MQLRPDALAAHLATPLAPLYVIASDEHLLAREAADSIRQAARAQGYTEREVLNVDRHFKWAELRFSGQTLSLFGDKKLIELRIPTGRPGREGSQALQDYARDAPADTLTLIALPRLDWQTQKAAWVTTLQKEAVFIDIPLVERTQLPAWIASRLAMQKQRADRDAIAFIVDRVEGNLLAAHQEIQKLGLLYPEGPISFEQVRDAVLNVARYDVFKLTETMLSGDSARLVRMLEGLKGEGEALPLALWAVTEDIRTLLKLRAGLDRGRPLNLLCKENRVWNQRERLMSMALQRLDLKKLKAAQQEAAQIDKMAKGLRVSHHVGDGWDALLQLALRIAKA